MTDSERYEQRQHWARENKLLATILGVLLTYGVGGIWWASDVTSRLTTVEQRTEQQQEVSADTRLRLRGVEVRESRTDQQYEGLKESVDRLRSEVAELIREIRRRP